MNEHRMRPIRRGDIYYADLAPVIDSEQGGVRPVLVIQNDIGNRHSPTIITAIVTGQLEQLRTLDRKRLRKYTGHLQATKMSEIDAALEISIGLVPMGRNNTNYISKKGHFAYDEK